MSTGTLEPVTKNGQKPEPQQRQTTALSTLKGWLQSPAFHEAIAKALPKHMTPDRFVRIAITAAMKTPKLMQCTQESMFNCLLQLSQMGLEPDGRRAHLIPFDVKKKVGSQWVVDHTDATLIVDYKGLAELVMRSGLVSNIHADIVCENDDFEYDKGFVVRHRVDFRRPRGKPYAAYAVVRFKDGTEKCEVMPQEEIYAIRDRSQGWTAFVKGWAKQSPWNPAEPVIEHEMWKKTAFRRLTKWVPLSAEIREAAELDDDQVDVETLRAANVIEATATTKSDALATMLEQQMVQRSDEPETTPDQPEEPVVTEDEQPQSDATTAPADTAPTLAGLLARANVATRITELHEIGDAGKGMPQADMDTLAQALRERAEIIEADKKAAAAAKK